MKNPARKTFVLIALITLEIVVNSKLVTAQNLMPFTINRSGISIQFDFYKGSVRQLFMQPVENKRKAKLPEMIDKSDLETAMQITGRMRVGRSFACGEPGYNFTYTGITETKTAMAAMLSFHKPIQ